MLFWWERQLSLYILSDFPSIKNLNGLNDLNSLNNLSGLNDFHQKKLYFKEQMYITFYCLKKAPKRPNIEKNKPERVFGLQVQCREMDIFKIRNFLRKNFWSSSGFFLIFHWFCFEGIF